MKTSLYISIYMSLYGDFEIEIQLDEKKSENFHTFRWHEREMMINYYTLPENGNRYDRSLKTKRDDQYIHKEYVNFQQEKM